MGSQNAATYRATVGSEPGTKPGAAIAPVTLRAGDRQHFSTALYNFKPDS
ncbi:MAG: hypothetical protein F6J93_21675 [Oscillatoria sp. SIO1A7]|nr:hypothetical protein [Oscillatoria sp. SIO1A7]